MNEEKLQKLNNQQKSNMTSDTKWLLDWIIQSDL